MKGKTTFGPIAVVTGATDGIGRAFAMKLAEQGYDLCLVARRGEILSAVASALHEQFGVEIETIPADLSTSDGVSEVLRRTDGQEVGMLVAAAGFGTSGDFIEGRLQDELSMIDVNCRAVAEMTHEFGNRFARRGNGAIVLMSSLLAFQGVPRAANYAATKAFIQSLAEGLRLELNRHGVEVIASAPGPISSGFARRARMKMALSQTPNTVANSTLQALGRRGTIRPGWLSKALEFSLKFLPRWGRVRALQRVMQGMTTHV